MSAKSKIEWTDVTWNPVRGCSVVSEGCRNCYAMKQAHRFSGKGQPYEGLTMIGQHGPSWIGTVRTVPELLNAPLHWKKPRRVFVNSMSDLFHRDVPHEFLVKAFAIMALTPQHTYQILTKRANRMQDWLSLNTLGHAVRGAAWSMLGKMPKFDHQSILTRPWPLPNVWLGVSIENQQAADERIPLLLQTPAAVRFISAEPLLGPVDLRQWMHDWGCPCGWGGDDTRSYCAECGWRGDEAGSGENCPDCNEMLDDSTAFRKCDRTTRDGSGFGPNGSPSIDWVVVGGESGPGARPCDIAWIRSLRDQCQAAGVPCFVKQLGANIAPVRIDGGSVTERLFLSDRKGGDMNEWPYDLRVREFPR